MARSTSRRARRSPVSVRKAAMVFSRKNYLYLGISLALVVVGYVAMRAENEVDGIISLYIAPILILAGYLGVIYAILWGSRTEETEAEPDAAS